MINIITYINDSITVNIIPLFNEFLDNLNPTYVHNHNEIIVNMYQLLLPILSMHNSDKNNCDNFM